MPDIKRGDFVKSVAQATGLSLPRAKKVAKEAGVDLGFAGRTLSKGQEKKAVAALSGAIKNLGYKVVGVKDEQRFKKKIVKSNTQFKQNPGKTTENNGKPLKSAVDFLAKVRQGVPGSKESETKEPKAVVSGSALRRQADTQKNAPAEGSHVRPQHVPLSDNFANIEAITSPGRGPEPIAPDIG